MSPFPVEDVAIPPPPGFVKINQNMMNMNCALFQRERNDGCACPGKMKGNRLTLSLSKTIDLKAKDFFEVFG